MKGVAFMGTNDDVEDEQGSVISYRYGKLWTLQKKQIRGRKEWIEWID